MSGVVQLAEGTIFAGDFRVIKPLSEGGMGAVYVVEQVSTGKQRALKVMHPQLVHDLKQRQRFVQEAKIGSRIESDHVVEVLGAGVDQATGTPWLVMELLAGETLDALIERRVRDAPNAAPLPTKDVVEIFAQLCHALSAAHDVSIVHRDLKPENIFLAVPRREGIPFVIKVLDFGIAKLIAESGTRTTQAIGSPLWMAPEQTNVDGDIIPATDVWALGLIAYASFTGHSYWRGAHAESPNPMTLVLEVCFEPLVPASTRAAEYGVAHLLPKGFDEWFARCVVREVEHRFKDAREARLALEKAFGAAAQTPSLPPPAKKISTANMQAVSVKEIPTAPLPGPSTLQTPDLDLPPPPSRDSARKVEAPKPEPQKPQKPSGISGQMGAVRPSMAGPESRPRPVARSSLGSTHHAAAVRKSLEERHAPPPRPFPWAKIGIGVGVVLVGLFVAQKFFWTQPSVEAPPPAPSNDEGKNKVAQSTSSSGGPATCPSGMARIKGGTVDGGVSVETFCLDLTEVTVKSYAECTKSKQCTAAASAGNWTAANAAEKAERNGSCNVGHADRLDHPINCVDWSQAKAYCEAQGKRLPTDVEWVWAARGGAVQWTYPWGTETPDIQLCWSSFVKRTSTCAVGAFPKGDTGSGVHDLAGNVREWTSTTIGTEHVHCGSDWTDKSADALKAFGYCGRAPAAGKAGFIGFRCAK